MFPLSDSAKSNIFPIATILLILINIYVFSQELFAENTVQFINMWALTPNNVNIQNLSTLIPFITSMFLHGGFLHIIVNMWFLWIFGDNVEAYFGKVRFILLYLFSGLAGNLIQFLINPNSTIPMLGASGAIAGVLGAYYYLFPQSRIRSLIFIFFFITIAEIPAVIYLIYWFFLQVFSGIASFSDTQSGGVAFWAHVGGFVTGILLAVIFKRAKNPRYIEGEIVSN